MLTNIQYIYQLISQGQFFLWLALLSLPEHNTHAHIREWARARARHGHRTHMRSYRRPRLKTHPFRRWQDQYMLACAYLIRLSSHMDRLRMSSLLRSWLAHMENMVLPWNSNVGREGLCRAMFWRSSYIFPHSRSTIITRINWILLEFDIIILIVFQRLRVLF